MAVRGAHPDLVRPRYGAAVIRRACVSLLSPCLHQDDRSGIHGNNRNSVCACRYPLETGRSELCLAASTTTENLFRAVSNKIVVMWNEYAGKRPFN